MTKILDRYVAKNYLIGCAIAAFVLIGLRMLIDLFVNLDEFTEHPGLSAIEVLRNIVSFYSVQSTIYFRDFAGMITVVAAAFSLGKMTRNNELVAIMASGVSLKRLIAPIVFLSLAMTGLLVIDQEFVIPSLAGDIVRSHDSLPGKEHYDIAFMTDEKGSLIYTTDYSEQNYSAGNPIIITRQPAEHNQWQVNGVIQADSAQFNKKAQSWDLINGRFTRIGQDAPGQPQQPIFSYMSDLKPRDIPIRRKAKYIDLMSSFDLNRLARQSPKNIARIYSQKHFRITDPIINLIMLLISLPILVCREPKAMKSAVLVSFAMTTSCFITTFICKMTASEALFSMIVPQLWAWLPIFIFLPIAFIELDSMKT